MLIDWQEKVSQRGGKEEKAIPFFFLLVFDDIIGQIVICDVGLKLCKENKQR